MRKPPPFNEIYFSQSSRTKPQTSQRSQRSQRTFLETFDIEKESLKLYSIPKSLRTGSVASLRNDTQTSLKLDLKSEITVEDRRINVYKDQSSPLMSQTRGGLKESSPGRPMSRRIYSPRLEHIGREKTASNSLSLGRERTEFTSGGTRSFLERFKAINKIEEVLTDRAIEIPEMGKKARSKRKAEREFGFITQRSEEAGNGSGRELDDAMVLRPECENRVFLRKYSFAYFSVQIQGRESPLKVTFSVEEGDKAARFKVYGSTRNRSPNKFNAEFEVEV